MNRPCSWDGHVICTYRSVCCNHVIVIIAPKFWTGLSTLLHQTVQGSAVSIGIKHIWFLNSMIKHSRYYIMLATWMLKLLPSCWQQHQCKGDCKRCHGADLGQGHALHMQQGCHPAALKHWLDMIGITASVNVCKAEPCREGHLTAATSSDEVSLSN